MSVIIISEEDDHSTNEVMDWLHYKKREVNINRFTFEQICQKLKVSYSLDGNTTKTAFNSQLEDEVDSIISVGWFRKNRSHINRVSLSGSILDRQVRSHLEKESSAVKLALLKNCANIRWLSSYQSRTLNKIIVLEQAKKIGLDVPRTLITNVKSDVVDFLSKCEGGVICKASSAQQIILNSKKTGTLTQYTTELQKEDLLANLPERFFPTLFQEKIGKLMDLRIFYLDKKCFSMGIVNTEVDYRENNTAFRHIPICLPEGIEEKIIALMEGLNLNIGCIDMIKDKKYDKTYFLEVNPNGQFNMVSSRCNFILEREISNFLLK